MRRIFAVVRVTRKILIPERPRLLWVTLATLIVILWVALGSSWTGTTITMWRHVVPSYPIGLTEKQTAAVMLRETLSFFSVPFFVSFLGRVAIPLSRSFSTSQVLWLRLSAVSPYQLLLARLLVVFEFLALWICSGGVVLIVIWVKHGLLPQDAIVPVLGPCSVFLFCAGFVLAVNSGWGISTTQNQLIVLLGLFLPSLFYIFRNTATYNLRSKLIAWYPTYLPFVDNVTWRNVLSIVFLGILLNIPAALRARPRGVTRN